MAPTQDLKKLLDLYTVIAGTVRGQLSDAYQRMHAAEGLLVAAQRAGALVTEEELRQVEECIAMLGRLETQLPVRAGKPPSEALATG